MQISFRMPLHLRAGLGQALPPHGRWGRSASPNRSGHYGLRGLEVRAIRRIVDLGEPTPGGKVVQIPVGIGSASQRFAPRLMRSRG